MTLESEQRPERKERYMRLCISLPRKIVKRLEALARVRHGSKSGTIAELIRQAK